MENFKFNFLSRGQFESSSTNNFFRNCIQMFPRYEYFLVTIFLHLLLKRSVEIVLMTLRTNVFFLLFYCSHICHPFYVAILWGHVSLNLSYKLQESRKLCYNLFWFPVPFIEYSVPLVTMKMYICLQGKQKKTKQKGE